MKNNKQQGFTLIEVMVALVIATISIIALFKAVSQTSTNIQYFKEKTLATIVISNLAVETRLVGQKIGRVEKSYKMAGKDWEYKKNTNLDAYSLTTEIFVYKNKQEKSAKSHIAQIQVKTYTENKDESK